MSRPAPGMVAAAGLVVEALVIDVVLIRRRHNPISTEVRSSWTARAVVAYLFVHLWWSFRWDPLSRLGRMVEQREATRGPVRG